MNRSMPGLPVHHQLPEPTQTHVHRVSDAIQPSYPLSSPSPPAPNPSQHQGLFKWVSFSHQVAKVSEFQLQSQSFQWTPRMISFRMDWLDLLAVQGTLKSLLQYHRSKALWIKGSKSIPEMGCSEKDQSGWAQIVDKGLRKAHTLDRRLYLCQFLMCNVCMTEVPLEWGRGLQKVAVVSRLFIKKWSTFLQPIYRRKVGLKTVCPLNLGDEIWTSASPLLRLWPNC